MATVKTIITIKENGKVVSGVAEDINLVQFIPGSGEDDVELDLIKSDDKKIELYSVGYKQGDTYQAKIDPDTSKYSQQRDIEHLIYNPDMLQIMYERMVKAFLNGTTTVEFVIHL